MTCLGIGLATLVGADEVKVQFRVEPKTAEVRVLPDGGWHSVDGPATLHLQQTVGELEFRCPGYRNLRRTYKRHELLAPGGWPPPPEPPVHLSAAIPWWLWGALPVLGAAGVLVTRRRRPTPPAQEVRYGDYLLGERLGQGGMATVYRGLPGPVALKVILPELARDPEYRARFLRECEVSAPLDHPHIVRTLGGGESPHGLYLALEFVEGTSLARQVTPGGQPLETVAPWLDALLDGLDYAHQRGVVHRDLKPDNIMLTREGQLKLMDFGLARRHDLPARITQTGSAVGTPAYMAPEQITVPTADPRTDQYALGVLAFELLTGQRPFDGADAMAIVLLQLRQPPPRPRSLRPELSPSVERWVLKLLAKDPEHRFPSMAAAREAFRLARHDPEAGQDWVVEAAVTTRIAPPALAARWEDESGEDTLIS